MDCLHRRGAAPGQAVLRGEAHLRPAPACRLCPLLVLSLRWLGTAVLQPVACLSLCMCPSVPFQAEFISKCIPDPLEHGVIDAMRKMVMPLMKAGSGGV